MAAARAKRKINLLTSRRLPLVIRMHSGLKKRGGGSDPPEYFAGHLEYWLRLYAIPGKPGNSSYPDGALLARDDAEFLCRFLADIFGRFAFLSVSATREDAGRVAHILESASRIFWNQQDTNGFHSMEIVDDPGSNRLLHESLLELLSGYTSDISKEEAERIAEYFAIFCRCDRHILKELAVSYHVARANERRLIQCIPSDD